MLVFVLILCSNHTKFDLDRLKERKKTQNVKNEKTQSSPLASRDVLLCSSNLACRPKVPRKCKAQRKLTRAQ